MTRYLGVFLLLGALTACRPPEPHWHSQCVKSHVDWTYHYDFMEGEFVFGPEKICDARDSTLFVYDSVQRREKPILVER